MPHSTHDVESWIGRKLVAADLQTVGTIEDIYLDAAIDEPEWLAIGGGRFSGGVRLVVGTTTVERFHRKVHRIGRAG